MTLQAPLLVYATKTCKPNRQLHSSQETNVQQQRRHKQRGHCRQRGLGMSHRGRRRGQQQTGSRRRHWRVGAIGIEARVTSETSPMRCPSCSRASISSSCPPASSLWSSLSRPLSSFLLPIVVAVAETEAGSVVRAAEQNNGGRRRGEGKSRRRKQELNPVLTR